VYIGALLKGEIEPTKLCRLCATDDPEPGASARRRKDAGYRPAP
jgi:hypothetical protein